MSIPGFQKYMSSNTIGYKIENPNLCGLIFVKLKDRLLTQITETCKATCCCIGEAKREGVLSAWSGGTHRQVRAVEGIVGAGWRMRRRCREYQISTAVDVHEGICQLRSRIASISASEVSLCHCPPKKNVNPV